VHTKYGLHLGALLFLDKPHNAHFVSNSWTSLYNMCACGNVGMCAHVGMWKFGLTNKL